MLVSALQPKSQCLVPHDIMPTRLVCACVQVLCAADCWAGPGNAPALLPPPAYTCSRDTYHLGPGVFSSFRPFYQMGNLSEGNFLFSQCPGQKALFW